MSNFSHKIFIRVGGDEDIDNDFIDSGYPFDDCFIDDDYDEYFDDDCSYPLSEPSVI